MNNDITSGPTETFRFSDIAAISVFLLELLGWFLALPLIGIVLQEWMTYPEVGDAAIGILPFGLLVLFTSIIFLMTAIALSPRAKRLSKYFRMVTIASPAVGFLVGIAMIYRALS